MAIKLLTIEDFKSSVRDGDSPDAMVVCSISGTAEPIPDSRSFKFVFSDGSVDRAGDTIDAKGWKLDSFKANPVALFGHSTDIDSVMGTAKNVSVVGGKLVGEIEFTTADINPKADMAYRMVQAGILNAVSVGFMPLDYEFSTDKNRPFGLDFKQQELLEISIVPVPANGNALIEARGLGIDTGPLGEWAARINDADGKVAVPRTLLAETFRKAKTSAETRDRYLVPGTKDASVSEWHVGAASDLPVDDSGTWDGPGASASIFADAGFSGDSPDAAKARRGFLLYDSANPTLTASYKLPFASVEGGMLKANAVGIKAAASRLSHTDVPASAVADARAVVDAYEARLVIEKAARLEAIERAGRTISADTKAKLQAAIDMHDQAATMHAQGMDMMKALVTDTAIEPGPDPEQSGDPAAIGDPMLQPMDGVIDDAKAAEVADRERRLRLAAALELQREVESI